ncbi:MAG: hypothetical protein JWM11_6293 [Planctomycetaceae bacterium]|nr:hypothetical protein [Planctomycetaceae bacterium]
MIRSISVVVILIFLGCTGYLCWMTEADAPPTETEARPRLSEEASQELQRLKKLAGLLEPLQQRLEKPQPGDWLAQHHEDGQTFAQFLEVRPAPIPSKLTTFYLQPIGEFTKTQQQLLTETAQGLELFYGRKVVVLPPVAMTSIPKSARRINSGTHQLQVLTTYVLDDVLKPHRPQDAIAILALSAPDLWPGKGWNFVFGQASLSERVGVWSIARFGDPETSPESYTLCLERMLGTALHESGHMLGIPHCTAWNCCMNGSNSLEEGDRHPLWFCAECQPKVWWACGLNPEKHIAAMARYAEQKKLKSTASHWKDVEQAIQ